MRTHVPEALTAAILVKWPYISVSEMVNLRVRWNGLNFMFTHQENIQTAQGETDGEIKRDKEQRQLDSVEEIIIF